MHDDAGAHVEQHGFGNALGMNLVRLEKAVATEGFDTRVVDEQQVGLDAGRRFPEIRNCPLFWHQETGQKKDVSKLGCGFEGEEEIFRVASLYFGKLIRPIVVRPDVENRETMATSEVDLGIENSGNVLVGENGLVTLEQGALVVVSLEDCFRGRRRRG